MHSKMLNASTIHARLQRMKTQTNPGVCWDETCEGSACALVIFVGPSPGGAKPNERTQLKTACVPALWNEAYVAPRSWSRGFQVSFEPLVEAILGRPYGIAGKLVGRANMDWINNPESSDVAVRYMWREGAPFCRCFVTYSLNWLFRWTKRLSTSYKSQCMKQALL